MECIIIVSYSILINGSLEGKIQSTRDIRQGDPLFPYIFILCVEFLGRELSKHSENLKNHLAIPSHRNGPKIPFVMFADNYVIFAKASHIACNDTK